MKSGRRGTTSQREEPRMEELKNGPDAGAGPDAGSTGGAAAGQNLVQRLGPASAVALFFAIMPLIGIGVLAVNIKEVAAFLQEDWWRGIAVYVGAFAALSGFALAPTWPQSLVGGYIFGLAWGGPAAVVAIVIGSVIGTEVSRLSSGHRVEKVIEEHPKWRAVRDALVGGEFFKTLGMVTLVRLPPNSPFAITNLVLGATEVPRLANVIGTLVGIAPRTIVTVYVGTTIRELTQESVTQSMPRWLLIPGIVLMVGVVLVIGQIGKRAMARVETGQAAGAAPHSGQGESEERPARE